VILGIAAAVISYWINEWKITDPMDFPIFNWDYLLRESNKGGFNFPSWKTKATLQNIRGRVRILQALGELQLSNSVASG
jgi:hypothetical protein